MDILHPMSKKVTFGTNTTFVFLQSVEDVECRLAYWEIYARDAERFKIRIMRSGEQLESVLTSTHRQQIYITRFLHKK
jgi:hypothetical protein